MFGKIKRKIEELQTIRNSVRNDLQHGKYDEYTIGYHNGIEFALSLLEDRKPDYCALVNDNTKVYETEEQQKEIKRTQGGIIQ